MLWSEDLESIIEVWCKANDNTLGSLTQTDGRTRGGLSVDIQVQLPIDKKPTSGVSRALHACNATDATKSKDCIFLRPWRFRTDSNSCKLKHDKWIAYTCLRRWAITSLCLWRHWSGPLNDVQSAKDKHG